MLTSSITRHIRKSLVNSLFFSVVKPESQCVCQLLQSERFQGNNICTEVLVGPFVPVLFCFINICLVLRCRNCLHVLILLIFLLQPAPVSKFIQGYVGAVTSAVSIAVSFHNASALTKQWYHHTAVVVVCSIKCLKLHNIKIPFNPKLYNFTHVKITRNSWGISGTDCRTYRTCQGTI